MKWQEYKTSEVIHFISLGAGRQSSIMYLMALTGEIEPKPEFAVFADTGNEPPHVYMQLDYLMICNDEAPADRKIPIHVVSNGDIYQDTMHALNGINPWNQDGDGERWLGPPVFSEGGGPIRRKCTRHYKIKPKENFIKAEMNKQNKRFVVDWRGHTINEIRRVKPDDRKYYIVRWPLIEKMLNDSNLNEWGRRHGHFEFKWSACEICPYRLRQKNTAIKLAEMPGTWERIRAMDDQIRDLTAFGLDKKHYFNADYLPVDRFVEMAREEQAAPSLFDLFENEDCDSGECGL